MTEHNPTPDAPARRFTDQRGIALQTVIIMVVMLAIAGAIAAVLLSRGNEASSQLETQQLGIGAKSYTSESLCKSAGHNWDSGRSLGKCYAKDLTAYNNNNDACVANGGNYKSNGDCDAT